jgi:cytochrome b subunit of formate dehydrogenase/mono/diheme cytochrome c family protein
MAKQKQPRAPKAPPAAARPGAPEARYRRFTWLDRLEHWLFMINFSLLALTGLPQKFSAAPISQSLIAAFGGIEQIRVIHHMAAIVLMAEAILHIVTVGYRAFVMRRPFSMLPVLGDFTDLWQNVSYHLGLSRARPQFGRYSYEEKVEYLAVVWGMIIMIITGFFMWNPIATTRLLPGEIIPAAKVAHGAEAVLAVLAIILWHFYNVHLRHFNKSMFTGQMTESEMQHEHPAELAEIKAGLWAEPPAREQQKRRLAFLPGAALLAVALGLGLFQFVTFEQTAIETLPTPAGGPAFVPQTPTATAAPSATPVPAAALTWDRAVGALVNARCAECHGADGGLALTTYAELLAGGESGPAVVPGDPEAGSLVASQVTGDHPGQFSGDELAQVRRWIEAGAPEN